MSTKTRNLSNIDGANVSNPDESDFSSNGIGAYPNDAAFEAMLTPVAGSLYFNTTENCLREYNGTSWQYDKTIFSTQTDATTTGSNQDITPSVDQIIRFTHGSLASIQGIIPTTQKVLYLVNDQASQSITVQNQAAGATAANRIITGNGADLVVMAGRVIGLVYDEDAARWRVVSGRVPSSALEVHASDAAYQTAHPGFGQGAEYFNSVSLLVRQYNGTAWQNDKTSYETQTDSTTTGASQDITPNTFNQVIRFTHGSLTSIRSIVPTNQTVVYFVNGQASQVITIKNEDTGATAANRIVTGTGADFSLAVGQMIALVYDSGGTRWRLAGAASSGGSGTDGINLIGSPSTATGWSETGTVFATPVTTTTSGDLPLEGATNSAIQFVATGNGSEATNYNSYPVTTSAAMNGALQVDLFMRPGTGFVASEWTISVYQGSTRQALRHDVSSVSYLPNGTLRYTTVFDAIASTAYTLRFARISGSGSATLNVCNVFLGWPFVSSIAPIGKETAFAASSPNSSFTVSASQLQWRQVGSFMHLSGRWSISASPATEARLAIPYGTIGTYAGVSISAVVGRWERDNAVATANKQGTVIATPGTNYLNFGIDDTSGAFSPTTPRMSSNMWDPVQTITFVGEIVFPLAEFAGSVSTGPAPAEEFASNDGSGGTAANTQYTTGSVVGGSFFVSTNGATVTAGEVTDYAVNFQYPIQADDHLSIEILNPGSTNEWMPIESCGNNIVLLYRSQNASYGMGIKPRSSTSVWVSLGNGGRLASGAFGAAGAGWGSATTYKWRVRKTKKASLPYANATGTSSGLIPLYEEGTWSGSFTNGGNITGIAVGGTFSYTRLGNTVFARITSISGLTTTTAGVVSILTILPTSLPGLTVTTQYYGGFRADSGATVIAGAIEDNSGATTVINLAWSAQATGGATTLNSVFFSYVI